MQDSCIEIFAKCLILLVKHCGFASGEKFRRGGEGGSEGVVREAKRLNIANQKKKNARKKWGCHQHGMSKC